MLRSNILALTLTAIILSLIPGAIYAEESDISWSGIPSTDIILFYPGVTSWEFLLSDDHRLGGRKIKKLLKDCRHCHLSKENELDLKADEIAAGSIKMKRSHKPFEPEPLPGKKGTMHAMVQAAYNDDNIYVRVVWESKGAGWRAAPSANVNPDRVSMQINKTEAAFKKYGCFITCHNDLNSMPGSPSKASVAANGYYKNLNRDDVRLYAYYARNSWSKTKDKVFLDARRRKGGLIDLLSLELASGKVKSRDGWILEDRRWDNGRALKGNASWEGMKYTAIFTRRLRNPDNRDLSIRAGDILSIGLSIHEDGAVKRKHYVSFPFTIGIGVKGDIKAEKVSR